MVEAKQWEAKWLILYGTPDWVRTSGLQIRSLTLYPAELRAQPVVLFWGERWELNPRPPGPQPGALTT